MHISVQMDKFAYFPSIRIKKKIGLNLVILFGLSNSSNTLTLHGGELALDEQEKKTKLYLTVDEKKLLGAVLCPGLF